jgi:hypothetical protein
VWLKAEIKKSKELIQVGPIFLHSLFSAKQPFVMNTILGASGQVGSAVVADLLKNRQPVKGVIRRQDQFEGVFGK